MNGLLLLCPKSARLHYSAAWTENFGVASAEQPSIDAMNLAALVYAIHVNACATLGDEADNANVLHSVEHAGSIILFRVHSSGWLMGVLFIQPELGRSIGRHILDAVVVQVGDKYSEHFSIGQANTPTRTRVHARARAQRHART